MVSRVEFLAQNHFEPLLLFGRHSGNASKSNVRGYAAAGLEASLHNLLTRARLWRVLTHCTWEKTTVAISKCGSKAGRVVSGTDMSLWVDTVAREGE